MATKIGNGEHRVVQKADTDDYAFLAYYKAEVVSEICNLNGIEPNVFKKIEDRVDALKTFPFLTIPILVPLNPTHPKEETNEIRFKNFQKLTSSDDIEDYLERFQEQAVFQKKKPEDWPLLLSPFLTGTAASAWASLVTHQKRNFGLVKEAILNAYQISEQTYRDEVLETYQKPTKMTFVEYGNLLLKKTKRWLIPTDKSADHLLDEKAFTDLLERLVVGFICQRYKHEPNLVMKITEKKASLNELMRLADEYHVHITRAKVQPSQHQAQHQKPREEKANSSKSYAGSNGQQKYCDFCKMWGHTTANCRRKQNNAETNGKVSGQNLQSSSQTQLQGQNSLQKNGNGKAVGSSKSIKMSSGMPHADRGWIPEGTPAAEPL